MPRASGILFVRQAFNDPGVAVGTVDQAAADAGDGGGGDAGFFVDGAESFAVVEHLGHHPTLGHDLDLTHGAKIVKEAVAVLFVLQRQDRLVQMVSHLRFHFAFVHDTAPLS